MVARLSLVLILGLIVGSFADVPPATQPSYNGIERPDAWPPREEFAADPQRPPYLASLPKVIPIDVGRQLFVDDFLIQETTLKRTFHQPRIHADTPVLKPDHTWEQAGKGPFAAPFSDGVWYDSKEGLFKMWYYAGHSVGATCYATSKDGIHWDKPKLDVVPETNIVLKQQRDSGTVWIDPAPADPAQRYKMALWRGGRFMLYHSADGIHWTQVSDGAKTGDRTTFFYNPFRQKWVYSIRVDSRFGRSRLYYETSDFWKFDDSLKGQFVPWLCADSGDPMREDLKLRPQLYNLDCAAYESLMVGFFAIWRGDYRNSKTDAAKELLKAGRPKQNSICVGFSRDGFHFDRPDRRPFVPTSEKMGDWNWGNVQSTAPGLLVVKDELWFFVSGRAGKGMPGCKALDAGASTGLAILRRDGFASMDAIDKPGTLTTRPIRFAGKHLFVNLDAPGGELRAEVLDENGRPIAGLDREHCRPVKGDGTRLQVMWEGAKDLSAASGPPVRLRFELTRGRLFSFWVTSDPGGASHGPVGGGGPGISGWVDG